MITFTYFPTYLFYARHAYTSLKKILEREDQYLYVARRTFTNLFLGVTYLHRATSNLKNEILPKKSKLSFLKISICIFALPFGRTHSRESR